MKFTVVWSEDAERKLFELWLAAADRRAATEATNEIDIELRCRADTAGEERSDTKRVFVVPPLVVEFRVSTDDRLASVFAVWRYPPQPPDD